MTATYTVDVTEVDDFAKVLQRYPEIARTVFQDALAESVILVVSYIQPLTPVNTGFLRGSITGNVEVLGGGVGGLADMRGIVESDVDYALDVEIGLPAGTWIDDIESLKRWAHLVLGNENAAYAVRASIFARGTRIHPHGSRGYYMFARGWFGAKPFVSKRFVDALAEITAKVGRAHAR